MIADGSLSECDWEEYLLYLYSLAEAKYSQSDDIDSLVMDSMLVMLTKIKNGTHIQHPKGFLAGVMKNKYNERLREKYKNRIVYFSDINTDGAEKDRDTAVCDSFTDIDEDSVLKKEYEKTRREIGRLIKIYREVVIRYYIRGNSVEQIANDLGISCGTVKSRLSSARMQIKEGLNKMEKYSNISYAPKQVNLGIWGSAGINGEPFSLMTSPIEGNLLYLAYERPVSVRAVAEAMGMPTAYLEPIAERLIKGELLGKTDGGLIYTRCFMKNGRRAAENIPAIEALAGKYAEKVWSKIHKEILPLTEEKEFAEMNGKQKATLLLYAVNMLAIKLVSNPELIKYMPYEQLPERPNGGRWLAIATSWEHGENSVSKYSASGPAYARCDEKSAFFELIDFQSVFGNTHHSYGQLKYNCSVHNAAWLIAGFINEDIKPDDDRICSLVPDFEDLHILRKDENGKTVPDIPILSFEYKQQWDDAITVACEELFPDMKDEFSGFLKAHKNNVPNHVDYSEQFLFEGALRSYNIAQMLAIVDKGLLPYPVKIGQTPVMVMSYSKK